MPVLPLLFSPSSHKSLISSTRSRAGS